MTKIEKVKDNLRWRIIEYLNDDPRTCWSNLVSWVYCFTDYTFWEVFIDWFYKENIYTDFYRQWCRSNDPATPWAYCNKCELSGRYYLENEDE